MNRIHRLWIIIVITTCSCASTAEFKTSRVTPAAQGEVKMKELKNGNFNIVVKISELAEPDRLKPSRSHYIVWGKSKQGTYNLGELTKGDEDIWSLSTESTYEIKRIFISAEKDEKPEKMGRVEVLKSKKL